jgi:hypothetical protein
MALNDKPCSQCKNYDVIRHGLNGTASRGWCMVRSLYPAVEGPGQSFPDGVRRAPNGELAKPFIVVGSQVRTGCADFTQK